MRSVSSFVLAVLVVACSAPAKPAPVSDQARDPDPTTRASDELTTTKPISLGLVINGQEIWAGNEEVEADPAAQYHGALDGLRAAITEAPPSGKLPAGSQAVVVTYATGAVVRLPLGPVDRLTADTLGKQAGRPSPRRVSSSTR